MEQQRKRGVYKNEGASSLPFLVVDRDLLKKFPNLSHAITKCGAQKMTARRDYEHGYPVRNPSELLPSKPVALPMPGDSASSIQIWLAKNLVHKMLTRLVRSAGKNWCRTQPCRHCYRRTRIFCRAGRWADPCDLVKLPCLIHIPGDDLIPP